MASRYRFAGHSSLIERDLLHIPQRAGALVEHGVAFGMQRVDQAAGLALAQAGLRPAQQLAIVIQAIDLAVAGAAIEIFRRVLHRPGLADSGDVFLEIEVHVEDLDAAVVAVGDIDMAAAHGDAVRDLHVPITGTIGAIDLLPDAILTDLHHARIDIAVADIDGAVRSPGDIGGAAEGAHIALGMGIGVLFAALDDLFT